MLITVAASLARDEVCNDALAFVDVGAYVHSKFGAGVGERQRDGAPDVPTRAGDERDSAVKWRGIHL
jgi:hypothetical protein